MTISEGIKSVIKTNVLRRDRSDTSLIDERKKICLSCEHATKYSDGSLRSCGKFIDMFTKITISGGKTTKKKPCGCILNQKIKDKKQKCPLGKW